jgi:hypothetical protein
VKRCCASQDKHRHRFEFIIPPQPLQKIDAGLRPKVHVGNHRVRERKTVSMLIHASPLEIGFGLAQIPADKREAGIGRLEGALN